MFYLFLRERERETEYEQGRGGERGRHRIMEPDAGLKFMNQEVMT